MLTIVTALLFLHPSVFFIPFLITTVLLIFIPILITNVLLNVHHMNRVSDDCRIDDNDYSFFTRVSGEIERGVLIVRGIAGMGSTTSVFGISTSFLPDFEGVTTVVCETGLDAFFVAPVWR